MKAKNVGLIVAASFAMTFLVLGCALYVAWENFAPALPNVLQAQMPRGPQAARNNAFIFEAPFLDPQVANEQPMAQENLPQARGAVIPAKNCLLSGPHTHGNMTIFLIHGPNTTKNNNILTLQEAVEQNLAVVHDTGAGQLLIDNRGNAPLFIQSGDIVKGGIQDRTLPFDMVVPPLTHQVPLAALCVEQGRSGPRGNEMTTSFHATTEQLPGRTLRLAAYRHSQQDVWNNVKGLQANLTRNLGIQAPPSHSLQLTLEIPRVQEAVQEYTNKLAPAVQDKNDVIGFVVAVNGKVQAADTYASSALFQQLWPKLIRASAVEAVAEQQKGVVFNVPSENTVKAFLVAAEQGEAFRRDVSARTVVIRQETAQHLLLDTCDPTQQNVVLHRAILSK